MVTHLLEVCGTESNTRDACRATSRVVDHQVVVAAQLAPRGIGAVSGPLRAAVSACGEFRRSWRGKRQSEYPARQCAAGCSPPGSSLAQGGTEEGWHAGEQYSIGSVWLFTDALCRNKLLDHFLAQIVGLAFPGRIAVKSSR